MRRTLVVFASLVLLWTIVTQLNDLLAGARVYLFAGGLYVTFAALALPAGPGLAAVLLAGLLCDANTPVSFGTHTLLFAAAQAVLLALRDRLPHETIAGRVVVALLANLGLFLCFSALVLGRMRASAALWDRAGADLLASELLVVLAGPWFFSLQAQALLLSGGPETRWR